MRCAFAHTDLDLLLRNRGVKNLIICGLTTDVCVFSTLKSAIDRGYDCLLVRDACAAASEDLHEMVVKSIQMEGGIAGAVAACEDVVSAVLFWAGPEKEVYRESIG